MATLPKNSIPAMAQYMQGLKVDDKTEKALLVRIGTLIDSIVNSERGANNAGGVDKRSQINSRGKPQRLTGTAKTYNKGVNVEINNAVNPKNLDNYEIQVAADAGFSDPTTRNTFTTGTDVKGLEDSTPYYIRFRAITKDGLAGSWSLTETVTIDPAVASPQVDGTVENEVAVSVTFPVVTLTADIFSAASFGFQNIEFDTNLAFIDAPYFIDQNSLNVPNTSLTDMNVNLLMDAGSQQIITLDGFHPVNPFYITQAPASYMQVIRYNPIAIFDLITSPSIGNHSFEVDETVGTAPTAVSTHPTIWVKF